MIEEGGEEETFSVMPLKESLRLKPDTSDWLKALLVLVHICSVQVFPLARTPREGFERARVQIWPSMDSFSFSCQDGGDLSS